MVPAIIAQTSTDFHVQSVIPLGPCAAVLLLYGVTASARTNAERGLKTLLANREGE